MPASRKITTGIIACAAIILYASIAYAQGSRDFPLPSAIATDFTGMLSEDDLSSIEQALIDAHEKNSMDGHVVITLRTAEWHLEEYVKDYADYLQTQGKIEPSGWLIYISTADLKFGIAVQDNARESITAEHVSELELMMAERLDSDDLTGAVVSAVEAIADLPAPQRVQPEGKVSPNMLVFMGILVIVIVLMLRLRQLGIASGKSKK